MNKSNKRKCKRR